MFCEKTVVRLYFTHKIKYQIWDFGYSMGLVMRNFVYNFNDGLPIELWMPVLP